ncbi:MAG: o-succinylbenzoate synthase [Gemmatimonadetes bacterium]|nr:o-succinylbenzoate synthase [Gemmatimonadota bacterium]
MTENGFKIERITLREIRLPLREPFRISSGVTSERRILLLQLRDADGVVVWSECVAGEHPNYHPETIDTAWLVIREYIAPRLLIAAFLGPEAVHAELAHDFRGHNMAKAAVEMGAWALVAERRGVALARLLGGERDCIPVGVSLGIQESPSALVAKATDARGRGYRRIKLKIQPGADVDYVAAVRAALGPDAVLTVDANSAYTLGELEVFQRLDGLGLLFIEQPLAWDDLVRHAELQRRMRTPLCLDESITGPDRVEDMITLGSGRVVNIKPGRVGGFTASKAIHDLCRARGIPVWCGGMLESGVGRAYNVALASLPNFVIPGDVSPSARYWARDVVLPEWTMDEQGMVRVPVDRPGIGVRPDLDFIDAITVRAETVGSGRAG